MCCEMGFMCCLLFTSVLHSGVFYVEANPKKLLDRDGKSSEHVGSYGGHVGSQKVIFRRHHCSNVETVKNKRPGHCRTKRSIWTKWFKRLASVFVREPKKKPKVKKCKWQEQLEKQVRYDVSKYYGNFKETWSTYRTVKMRTPEDLLWERKKKMEQIWEHVNKTCEMYEEAKQREKALVKDIVVYLVQKRPSVNISVKLYDKMYPPVPEGVQEILMNEVNEIVRLRKKVIHYYNYFMERIDGRIHRWDTKKMKNKMLEITNDSDLFRLKSDRIPDYEPITIANPLYVTTTTEFISSEDYHVGQTPDLMPSM